MIFADIVMALRHEWRRIGKGLAGSEAQSQALFTSGYAGSPDWPLARGLPEEALYYTAAELAEKVREILGH
jgi:hypothetical protein